MCLEKIRQKFDLSVVKSLELEDLSIDFTMYDNWTTALFSHRLIARLAHIPGFSWPIQQVHLRITVQHKGVDIGSFESPYAPASVSRGVAYTHIPNTTLTVFDQAHAQFAEFVAALATQPQHTFSVKGSADIIIHFGVLGTHTIKGIDFLSDVTLKGLNNLPEINCTYVKEMVLYEQERVLEVTITLDIMNQSQLMLTLGDVALKVFYNTSGTLSAANGDVMSEKGDDSRNLIGTIMIRNLTLLQGMNDSRTATIKLNTSLERTRPFLANIARAPQKIHLRGYRGTSKNEILTAGLNALTTSFVIPAFQAPSLKGLT
ncbi:MAG: hypothetical protein J3Q66DRAFT_437323 [Benniella sp.]|nr:MAG: hypothetical protein J3Q66DRAFT_437323 [Benniella sp.]